MYVLSKSSISRLYIEEAYARGKSNKKLKKPALCITGIIKEKASALFLDLVIYSRKRHAPAKLSLLCFIVRLAISSALIFLALQLLLCYSLVRMLIGVMPAVTISRILS